MFCLQMSVSAYESSSRHNKHITALKMIKKKVQEEDRGKAKETITWATSGTEQKQKPAIAVMDGPHSLVLCGN